MLQNTEVANKTEVLARQLVNESEQILSRLNDARTELYQLATRINGSFPLGEEKPLPKEPSAPDSFVEHLSKLNDKSRTQLSEIETIIRRLKEFA